MWNSARRQFEWAIAVLVVFTSCDNGAYPVRDTTERIMLVKPSGGERFRLGDTVKISVEYRNSPDSIHFVTFWFTPDNGKTYDFTLFPQSILFKGQRKDTVWIIPSDQEYVSNSANVRVEDYSRSQEMFDYCDKPFIITQ